MAAVWGKDWGWQQGGQGREMQAPPLSLCFFLSKAKRLSWRLCSKDIWKTARQWELGMVWRILYGQVWGHSETEHGIEPRGTETEFGSPPSRPSMLAIPAATIVWSTNCFRVLKRLGFTTLNRLCISVVLFKFVVVVVVVLVPQKHLCWYMFWAGWVYPYGCPWRRRQPLFERMAYLFFVKTMSFPGNKM